MFTNFIFIIFAILAYSIHLPGDWPRHPWFFYLPVLILYFSLYSYIVRWSLKKNLGHLEDLPAGGRWQRGKFHFHLNRHLFLALAFYTVLIFFLEWKSFLSTLPSETLRNVLGVLPFFLFLALLGFHAWPYYRVFFQSSLSRAGYIFSQFRFNLPVILPWTIATFCIDLAFLLPNYIQDLLAAHEWSQLILYAFFFLFLGIFFPLFIQLIWGCRPVEDPDLLHLLAEICETAGVRVRRAIMWPVMEAQIITAGVMGIVGRFRYILLTPSIIEILSREELKSVLAHELGHTKKGHLHFFLFFFMGYVIISFLYPDAFFLLLYLSGTIGAFSDFFISGDKRVIAFLFFAPMAVILVLYFRYLFGFFSRNFERQADLFALNMMGRSGPLVSALEKVALVNGIDMAAPNWHHYSIRERVDFLMECENRGERGPRHNRKVFYSKFLFASVLALALASFVLSQQHPPLESIKLSLIESSLLKMGETKGDSVDLHLLLATVRLEKNDERGAVESYRRALELDPRNAAALNNLAWLLVTGKDAALRDYKEGLKLAESAVSIERKSYVLDTLAECYFVNGETGKAILAEEEALRLEKGDKTHYERQLERFRKK